MIFHDPMAVAQDKMTQVCQFLEQHHLPPTPLNYQVTYTYISKSDPDLNTALNRILNSGQKIDSIYLEQLYFEHINQGHREEAGLLKNVDAVLSSLQSSTKTSQRNISQFSDQLHQCVHSLDEHNVKQSKRALELFSKQIDVFVQQHVHFKETLEKARVTHQKTQQQLLKLRKQYIIDLQTGMYKRHYLNQQTQLWLKQQKSICAIAIQVENIHEFSEKYGDAIGEVVLHRVAKKIRKYVFESGLPGRTGKSEFTVLLPDIELDTALVIAEKVRKGVEKLKFTSSKSPLNLPNIELSVGIIKQQNEGDFTALARKASQAAHKALILKQEYYIPAS
jgi:diguanylate cyclase